MTISNAQEIHNFDAMANEWWDLNGKFKPLHKLNPTRIAYIERQVKSHFDRDNISELSILDVGCGGGLVCEPLARMGANVIGIDAGKKAIEVAKEHAKDNGLDITYHCELSHDHKGKYDVVLALEILEHLDDVEDFIASLKTLVKKDGLIIFSTLNRTPKSFALGIVAAEYILRWVPTGTHNWKKFIKPSELARMAQGQGMTVTDVTGLIYNPFLDHFSLSNEDVGVNYFMSVSAA